MAALLEGTEIKVGIAQWWVARGNTRIVTLGLGSCVGIALWEAGTRTGGLAHIMLPESANFPDRNNPGKFADTAIPLTFQEMVKTGARAGAIVAKIAGGAQMFNFTGKNGMLNIGQRNVEATKQALERLKIKLLAEHTGGNLGRTMILDVATGQVTIRTLGHPLIYL
ncbi:MAG: chemotaxis protein CheD [Clostridia bacterium]|nr:MAG: chemotaxis protein CheD [Clostridia bacterium]